MRSGGKLESHLVRESERANGLYAHAWPSQPRQGSGENELSAVQPGCIARLY
jgi:hypothetical protein